MRDVIAKKLIWVVVGLLVFAGRGTAQDAPNVAPNGIASQSTTAQEGFLGGEADNAIDERLPGRA